MRIVDNRYLFIGHLVLVVLCERLLVGAIDFNDEQMQNDYGKAHYETKQYNIPIGVKSSGYSIEESSNGGHGSVEKQESYSTKYGLHKLPLVGGLFSSKTYSSSSSGGGASGLSGSETYSDSGSGASYHYSKSSPGTSYHYKSGGSAGGDSHETSYEFKTESKEKVQIHKLGSKEDINFNSAQLELQSEEKNFDFGKSSGAICHGKPPTPINSAIKCSSNICKAKCMADHQFPNGETLITLKCINGDWTNEGVKYQDISCEPICMPPCKNSGICISPGQCSCPDNFIGPYCEHEKKLCVTPPPLPRNSKRSCSSTACTITCANGHKFPDGTSVVNLVCKEGDWIPSRTELAVIPDCSPTCTPECKNGGQCLSFNVCQCPRDFRGNQCQYNVDVCSPKKLNFNGAFNCSGDNEHMRCILKCPKDIQFDGTPAPVYTCAYNTGIYLPAQVPQCKYPEGAQIELIEDGGTSQTFYKSFNQTFSSGSSGQRIKKIKKKIKQKEYEIDDSNDEDGYEKVITKTEIKIVKKKKTGGKGRYQVAEGDEYEYEEIEEESGGGGAAAYQIFSGAYSLYLSGDVNIKHRTPKSATCMSWNGNKFKTFDGLLYNQPIYCAHTLVQDMIDGTFSVVLKACSIDAALGANCPFGLDVYLQNIKYSFDIKNGTIRLYTGRAELPIPTQMQGIRVSVLGHNLKINLETVGLTIIWDLNRLFVVEATAGLFNRTAGLCGTSDQHPENDFVSKNGALHKMTSTFVDSWQVTDDSITSMKCHKEQNNVELTCTDDIKTEAKTVCEKLLSNAKFSDCLKIFSKSVMIETCISDYCYCPNKNRVQCACDGISVFARDCQFNGISLANGWRDTDVCPLQCKSGRIYKACGPSFEPSCGGATEEPSGNCNEGCFCPDGTLQHNGECVQLEKCPCTLRGRHFKPGSQINKDCNTCSCDRGVWKCSDESCGARCAAIGDPHYTTFDGRRFDFMGKCSYYLLKGTNYSIEAENVACPGSISEDLNFVSSGTDVPSCTKSVSVNIQNGDVTKTIKLKQGKQVLVDGIEIQKLPIKVLNGLVIVRQASSMIILVSFKDGLKISWDGTRVYIDAPASYRGKTKGLCGTFNSNLQDDFLSPEGDVETAVSAFANKWRTREFCDYVSDEPDIPHPCKLNIENKEKALHLCTKLKSEIFSQCHWHVDPDSFYEDCVYDVCACKGDIATCLCPIFNAYSNECNRLGSPINWRYSVNECAVKCPAGQVFEECGDECFRTCGDLQSTESCKTGCVEGCRCPPGQALDDSGECVPVAMCPCTFKGLTFKPGYKEVRPGTKHQELCTCTNAKWKCKEAVGDDSVKYPPALDIRSRCLTNNNEEFTTCEPAEPKTCKNMHNYHESRTLECHPGCVCKKGFVFDSTTKKCVAPTECSCHHGSQSYNDGAVIKSDCNTCTCKAGNWNCSDRQCPSTCTTWGDSHFETFDGRDFDFQGACNYVLAKGVLSDTEGFSVTIQNVLCGSLGVTCSKALTISTTGKHPETVTLSSDISIPGILGSAAGNSSANEIEKWKVLAIHQAGIFIVVEAPAIGLQIKWDRGTRVYIKLAVKWKGRVQGLCGNYNGDALDDFKTPSQGVETNANIFGDSWKLQDFCSKPTDQIDSCEAHSERKIWSERKCGILKSDVFKPCHDVIPVDKFLKRCIYDTCACDQGGDCECLCTALAAYAHACTIKGIPIRWRTPSLCPMQCDPKCSSYKSCISSCPVETCDNANDRGKDQKLCLEDTCVEGCDLKLCPDGQIYRNNSYVECVPKSVCKPVCLEKNNVMYYEGDIIKQDNCHTCRCTNKKEICVGIPCPTKSILPYHTTVRPYGDSTSSCVSGWSKWINEDKSDSNKPSGYGTDHQKTGDVEPLPSYLLLKNLENSAACSYDFIKQIECRTVGTHINPKQTGEDAECSLERGLLCAGPCHDYEIRVLCDCDDNVEVFTLANLPKNSWTPHPLASKLIQSTTPTPISNSVCSPEIPHVEFPGDCYKFLHCQPHDNLSWRYVEKTCGPAMMFNPQAMVCDWPDSVKLIKPECGTGVLKPSEPLKTGNNVCPPGKVWNDCAIPCGRTCNYYGKFLQRNGECLNGHNVCEGGCVDENSVIYCPPNQVWMDNKNCVTISDCTCESEDGKLIKPGAIYKESDCKFCQCIDNVYVCNTDLCVKPIVEEVEEVIFAKPPPVQIVVNPLTPPEKCESIRLVPLIEATPGLPDSAFNASSFKGASFKPQHSRLNSIPNEETSGAWSPEINDQMQYLQITFNKLTPLYGIIIRGHPLFDQYVTSFKILHSTDGLAFHYLVDESTHPQVFTGCIDSRTPVRTLFKIPIESKVIRIYPLTWHDSISIRAELLGCSSEKTLPNVTPTPSYFDENKIILICDEPMGVDNGKLKPNQIKVSSTKTIIAKSKISEMFKLSSPQGWRPNIDSTNEYVIFDFLESRNVTGLKTKGGEYGWVTGFTVYYSQDEFIWNPIINADGSLRTFLGNYDSDTVKLNPFKRIINMRYLKVIPTKWHETIEFSIEPIGCFKPYPYRTEDIIEVVPVQTEIVNQTVCAVCPDVNPDTKKIENICNCNPPLFWNGVGCVERIMCPCMVGLVSYSVGAHFELEHCSKCVCTLGGVAQCKPFECPPCQKGLRKVPSKSACTCQCEPCPDTDLLCPSSGACIPKSSWCNGIQDCPDDETNCSHGDSDEYKVIKKTIEKVTIIKKCSKPSCPPGFRVEIGKKNGTDKPSLMLQSPGTTYGNVKNSIEDIDVRFHIDLPTPKEVDTVTLDECVQFDCVPIKQDIIQQTQNHFELICPTPDCPKGYEIVLQAAVPEQCAKYKCEPLPQNDAVCNVTGRTFNTFDDTTFKYDICNHLVARHISGKWSVTIQKNCSFGNNVCKKELTIKDKDNAYIIRLYTDLTLSLNGYPFTVDQLQQSPTNNIRSFVISKVGNTIVFISHAQGFWVRFDELGDVRIGVPAKQSSLVDGLCGFYNGISADDKRLPNGEQTLSTVDFGDSWLLEKDGKEQCIPHSCSQELQDVAYRMCHKIKDETFSQCHTALNVEEYISKCLETACDCLKSGNENTCTCTILQNFVSECLAADDTVHLDTWRSVHGCYKECAPPLIYKDCFRRRCEPSCTFFNGDDCPQLPGTCFSGCYCPEGTVRKGEQCVPVSECKNCVCKGFGKSQYLTYDRKNFTFDGNCTYLLSRDVLVPNVPSFRIYATLGLCDKVNAKSLKQNSCTKSLHILQGSHVVQLQRNEKVAKAFDIIVDSKAIKLPYECSWLTVTETKGKGIEISLIESQIEIDAQFDDFAFAIKVPGVKYASKLEGLCGDCNGNTEDDLKPNSKSKLKLKSDNLNDVLQTWLADEPQLFKENNCISKEKTKENCVVLAPEKDPCLTLLDKNIFGKCHFIVDPTLYVASCHTDLCQSGPKPESTCSYLAAYAKECSQHGICVDWKQGACRSNEKCPDGMVYEPCGCTRTCDDLQKGDIIFLQCPVTERDGCFCPKDKILSNGKCISKKECNACDDKGHFYGDKWHPDKCTMCECQQNGQVQCVKDQCTTETVCGSGFHKVVLEENACCPKTTCCSDLKPLECGKDKKLITTTEQGCARQECVCDPEVVAKCKPLPVPSTRPGEKIVIDESGCCPAYRVTCESSKCPVKPKKCDEAFYQVTKVTNTSSNACCDVYECQPPKNGCITEMKGKKYLKNIAEVWITDDPCVYKKCSYGAGGVTAVLDEKKQCQVTSCPTGYHIDVPKGSCCGTCVQTHCIVDGVAYGPDAEWKSKDLCTSFKCSKSFVISSMQPTCPDTSKCPPHLKYFENCCERCKLEPLNQENCLATSLGETETIGLVGKTIGKHGFCVNQTPIRGFTECNGACSSGTKFNKSSYKQDKTCHCCSVQSYGKVKVPVKCEDGHKTEIEIDVPQSCSCKPCDGK